MNKKMMMRFRSIALLIRIGWVQPGMFTVGTFKSMSTLMETLLKVANEGTPMMSRLAVVIANEQHDVVTIWAGKGANADPYNRIVELRDEIDELRRQLSDAVSKEGHP